MKEKRWRNSPPCFLIFIPKSRLSTFYPLSFGPLNDVQLVESQSKNCLSQPKIRFMAPLTYLFQIGRTFRKISRGFSASPPCIVQRGEWTGLASQFHYAVAAAAMHIEETLTSVSGRARTSLHVCASRA